MAAPNLGSSTVTIKQASVGLAVTNSAQTLVANASSSGTLVRVKSVVVSNIHASATGTITLQIVKNAGTTYRIAYQISVAIGTSLVLVDSSETKHLEENDTMQILADASSKFEAWADYDTIS